MLPPATYSNKASVVVSFPDGSRWSLELSPLQATAATPMPSLIQINPAAPEIRSGSVPTAMTEGAAQADDMPASAHTAESRSEQIPSASVAPSAIADVTPPVREEPASIPQIEQPQQALCTVELFFTDPAGRRLYFRDAVRRRSVGGWALMGSATAQLGMGRNEGYGLGGVPGRWKDYFRPTAQAALAFTCPPVAGGRVCHACLPQLTSLT